MGKKVLLAEDEIQNRIIITGVLEDNGYDVVGVSDGSKAVDKFSKDDFNLLILDIIMPKMDGLGVLKKIRENSKVPIMMLSSIDNFKIQNACFEWGADDYYIKNNLYDKDNLDVFRRKVDILLRRKEVVFLDNNKSEYINITKDTKEKLSDNTYLYNDLHIDFNGHTIKREGQEIKLARKPLALLKLLLEHKGQVMKREQILDRVWGYDSVETVGDRVIDTNIRTLRKKLNLDEDIVTYKGVGFKLK